MECANFVELAVAFYKDKTERELLEKFQEESRLLLQADAEARRAKARENILAMAKLKIELQKFVLIYDKISSSCGRIDAVDSCIRDIEKKVKMISYQKNHIKKL